MHGTWFTRVKLNEDWNGVFVYRKNLGVSMTIWKPLGESLDEIGLICAKFFFFPATAAAQQIVGEAADAPPAF